MTMNPVFYQLIESMNHTSEHFDFYCSEFPVGPIIWAILSSPSVIVGVPASVWLLWVLVQRQRSGGAGSSNVTYMLNLTIMDMLATIQVFPYQINLFLLKHDLLKIILDYFYILNLMGRPLLMACICWDCCMAVCYPIFYMRMTRTLYRLVTCTVAWAVAIAYASPVFIGKMPDVLLSIPYFLTLPVIVGCDVATLCALRKPDPSGKTDVHPQKQRALLAITQSLVLTVLVFLPPLVMLVFTPLMSLTEQEIYCHVTIPALSGPPLASVLMPLMYLHSLGSFRDLRRCGRGAGLDEE